MSLTIIKKDSEMEAKFKFMNEQYKNYNSFVQTWLYYQFITCPYKILFWDTGNKLGKTFCIARNYIERILGHHPIARKNVLYFKCDNQETPHEFSPRQIQKLFPHTGHLIRLNSDDKASPHIPSEECPECKATLHEVERYERVFRFSSGSLPMQGEDTYHKRSRGAMVRSQSLEVKNVQHPAFLRLLPPFLLEKDCTTRVSAQVIKDIYMRGPIMVEYTSYKQSLVTKTGASRLSIWPDEKMPEEEFADAKARVVLEKGDIVLSCTPIEDVSYTFYYNDIYEKARTFYRTYLVCKRMEEKYGRKFERIEHTDSKQSIAVFQGSSYDNPVIDKNEINELLATGDDQDAIDVKIYGLMLKLSGRIFAGFDPNVHLYDNGFDPFDDVNSNLNVRAYDFHDGRNGKEQCIIFGTLTPTNEFFIWDELCLDHATNTTDMIIEKIVEKSGTLRFMINLIDPYANKIQSNVNTTVVFDMNRQLSKLKREGIGNGGVFESADTKSVLGRENLKKRLANSIKCGKPYNNCIDKDGRFEYMPTIWIHRYKCPNVWHSLQKWSLDKNGNPEQKHSHFCTALEFIEKDIRFKPRMDLDTFEQKSPYANYFHVR